MYCKLNFSPTEIVFCERPCIDMFMFLAKIFGQYVTMYRKIKNYYYGCSYDSPCEHQPAGKSPGTRQLSIPDIFSDDTNAWSAIRAKRKSRLKQTVYVTDFQRFKFYVVPSNKWDLVKRKNIVFHSLERVLKGYVEISQQESYITYRQSYCLN